jgi:hypothetical protein
VIDVRERVQRAAQPKGARFVASVSVHSSKFSSHQMD